MNDKLAEIAENRAKPCQKAGQRARVTNVAVVATAANGRPAKLKPSQAELRGSRGQQATTLRPSAIHPSSNAHHKRQSAIQEPDFGGLERADAPADAVAPKGEQLVNHQLGLSFEPVARTRADREPEQGCVGEVECNRTHNDACVGGIEQVRLHNARRTRLAIVSRSDHLDDVTAGYVHPVVSVRDAQVSASERGPSLASKDWRRASAANDRASWRSR